MLTPNASCTLYLQSGPGAYTRVYVPACFWQDEEDGVSIIIPGELPQTYKGEKREQDYVVHGQRLSLIHIYGKAEDPAQRIPYTITNKLTKACFAEYDSSFTQTGAGKTAWLDGQRSLIDDIKQDVLQWVMVGGEAFLKPAPDGSGRITYRVVRRDCYNVLARGPHGITDVLMSERSRSGSVFYTLLEMCIRDRKKCVRRRNSGL